jgi:sigma-E factor negative regulatory protein RseC
MQQAGRVIDVTEEIARVEVKRASACGENCAMCKGGCMPTKHIATVSNALGAKPGDMVKIKTDDAAVIKSAALLYILPILILFVFYAIAFVLTENSAVSSVSGLIGLVGGFFILKAVDKKFAPVPEIVRIIYTKSEEED